MVRNSVSLSKKAQVSIEFILILVVMLAILGSVTFPTVNKMTDSAEDTSKAISLAAAQRRIINTAEEISMGSCGSYKVIGIYLTDVPFGTNILWNKTYVWGNFTNSSQGEETLRAIDYPPYIQIYGGACSFPCNVKNETFFIEIRKNCSQIDPSIVCPVLNGIGSVCP